MKTESIEQMIYDETESRLKTMESPDYEFPKKAGRGDYIGIAIGVAASVILIVLCMVGVIN